MRYYCILAICTILYQNLVAQILVDPVGLVHIGSDENDTTEIFTFNENYVSDFEIPVTLLLVNATTGEILLDERPSDNVIVNCETEPQLAGYTQATFAPVTVLAGDYGGSVGFSAPVPARPVDLRCWGESVSTDEFTKEQSLSNPRMFEIRPAGTVSVLDSVIQIANEADQIDVEGTFLVEFSEQVELYNVTVECYNVSNSPDQMQLDIPIRETEVGIRKLLMTYQLILKGEPVTITCSANSNTATEGQFQTATSAGSGSVFILSEGSVDLFPERSNVRTTQMNAYLVLDSRPTAEVIFACYLTMADDSAHAKDIASNPVCLMPDYIGPTRPPTNQTDSATQSPGVSTLFSVEGSTYSTDYQTDLTGVGSVSPFFSAESTPDGNMTDAPTPNVTIEESATTESSMSTMSTSSTTPAPVNITGEWALQSQLYTFEPNSDPYRRIVIERSLNVNMKKQELFVVTCCAPDSSNDSPKYVNQSAALVVASYLTPYQSINWTDAATAEEIQVDTEIIEPAYIEVSPCSCDLAEDSCEENCCCDPDCSSDDIQTFDCIPGVYGGNSSIPPSYMCSSESNQKTDWFPIMCVQWNNSAFLGYFYSPELAIREKSSYDDTANEFRPPHSFKEEGDRNPTESQNSVYGYQSGYSVRTGLEKQSSAQDYYIGENYRLTLPQRSLAGECVWSSPVKFLKESQHSCSWEMRQSLCTTQSPLSALIYAQSERWVGRKGILVLAVSGVSVIAETDVNYLCANSTEGYLRTTERYKDLVKPGESYLFDYELPSEEDCFFDIYSGAYVCDNQTNEEATVGGLPSRCSWDDGFTPPPSPLLEGDICKNSVVDVLYNFTWQGTEILLLNATVILTDIPLETIVISNNVPSNKSIINQNFEVLFNHQLGNLTLNETETDENDNSTRPIRTEQYKRSGYPGYDFGLPLFSGVAIYDENDTLSSEEFLYIDANTSNSLGLWHPGSDGLCLGANRLPLDFGINVMGNCLVKLKHRDLLDCRALRRLILNRQDTLMLSEYISVGGDPAFHNLDQNWAPVFREDIQYILDDTFEDTENFTMTTISSLTSSSDLSVVNITFLDYLTGRCDNIPSGIHIDVMYAEVGQRDAIPVYQVVGSKISYTLSTWKLYCVGPGGTACYTNATWVQDVLNGNDATQAFMLTSSVNYFQVPAKTPKPKTMYEEEHEPRVWKCDQDACWEEIFYPFMRINPGDDPQYTLAMGLIFLIFSFGAFLITRPVSRWEYIQSQL